MSFRSETFLKLVASRDAILFRSCGARRLRVVGAVPVLRRLAPRAARGRRRVRGLHELRRLHLEREATEVPLVPAGQRDAAALPEGGRWRIACYDQ